jgi:hypothetical protein
LRAFACHRSSVVTASRRSFAAAVLDIATYSDVKDPVVDLVIAVADAWAAASGWQP